MDKTLSGCVKFLEPVTNNSSLTDTTTVRVLYADTDAMGIVYHGHYFRWFEKGRCELMRGIGLAYKDFEDQGFGLPVVDMGCKFHRSARYDEELTLSTTVDDIRAASMRFGYSLSRGQTPIAEGFTRHACTTKEGKVTRLPSILTDVIADARSGANQGD